MRHFIFILLSIWFASSNRVQANLLQSILSKLKRLKDRRRRGGGGTDPKPTIVDQFLTPTEAQYLLDRYEFLMKDSLSVGYIKTKGASRSKYRTSKSVRLPPLGDSTLFDIERRAASLAGFNHSYCEDIQMACYEDGELHGLHRDDADAAQNADRSATVLIYLDAPDAGGETLFTLRPIEDERDLDTRGPLRTEDGALRLFQSYCSQPKKKFVVVEPRVGRAVTWRNWLGDDLSRFAEASTHGACPVRGQRRKCVIQQWISRRNKLPLRDERVAGIFPAGAELYYRGEEDGGDGIINSRCLSDVSANEGTIVKELCLDDDNGESRTSNFVQLDGSEGPYAGVGAVRINGGGVGTELPIELLDGGLTVSFWARDLDAGTTIFSIVGGGGGAVSLRYREKQGDIKQIFEFQAGDDLTEEIKVYSGGSPEEWFWFSVTFERGKKATAAIYSRGKLAGSASLDLDTCGQDALNSGSSSLRLLSPPPATHHGGASAGVASSSDLCFVVIHGTIFDDPQQVVALGQQAKRYDKNS